MTRRWRRWRFWGGAIGIVVLTPLVLTLLWAPVAVLLTRFWAAVHDD